jgi:hypothetical protein
MSSQLFLAALAGHGGTWSTPQEYLSIGNKRVDLVALTGIEGANRQFSSVRVSPSDSRYVQLVRLSRPRTDHRFPTLSLGCHSTANNARNRASGNLTPVAACSCLLRPSAQGRSSIDLPAVRILLTRDMVTRRHEGHAQIASASYKVSFNSVRNGTRLLVGLVGESNCRPPAPKASERAICLAL